MLLTKQNFANLGFGNDNLTYIYIYVYKESKTRTVNDRKSSAAGSLAWNGKIPAESCGTINITNNHPAE